MRALVKNIIFTLLLTTSLAALLLLGLGLIVSNYSDQPRKADLIIILGGDKGLRVKTGGKLYLAGYAPRILLTGIDAHYYNPRHPNWRERRLSKMGIPKQAVIVDTDSESTWEEASNTVRLMKKKGWKRVIVVSDPPHLLRLQLSWSRAMQHTDMTFMLVPTKPVWWHQLYWWKTNKSYSFVISEIQKNIFYALHHY